MVQTKEITYFNSFLVVIVLALIGFSVYSNVLHGEFISDDHVNIVTNPAVRDAGNVQAIFQSFNTRFLVGLTFALNYKLGGLEVFGYHFVNILIHIFAAFLTFQFVRLTFQSPALRESQLSKSSHSIAFLSSLIFLCHPIQTQGVAFITQRAVSMATSFYLLTLVLYILARLKNKKSYYYSAIGTMTIGLFCKENIATLPLMLLVHEYFFFKDIGTKRWGSFKRIIPFFLLCALLPLRLLQEGSGTVLGLKGQLAGHSIKWNYFFTEINVLRTYLRLFVLPIRQNHYYDYPLADSFFELSTMFSVFLLVALLVMAVYLFSRNKLISFCIFWFFITTSVEFSVVSVIGRGVIYEHWLYLPMVGFAILLSFVIHSVIKSKRTVQWIIAVLTVVMGLASYQRNKVWQNETKFWQDVLKKSPKSSIAYFAAGSAYSRQGNTDMAMQLYHKGLLIDPNSKFLLNNVGILYGKMGNNLLAMKYFKKTLKVDPDFIAAYNNMGFLYFRDKKYRKSIEYYNESIQRETSYPDSYFYRGKCYLELGEMAQAQSDLRKALNLYENLEKMPEVKETRALIKGTR